MTTVLLVRHGLTAMTGPVLAGRTLGLGLDERGRAQAAVLAQRLAPVPLAAIVSSPLDRCLQTAGTVAIGRPGPASPVVANGQPPPGSTAPPALAAQPAVAGQAGLDGQAGLAGQEVLVDRRLIEVGYGDWTGRKLQDLAKEPLWSVVQQHPSAAVFPGEGGEALAATQARAVAAVREWNARLGDDAVWLACSHGDVIKAVLADALGLHLDQFQRIVVDPCSVSVVNYLPTRPFVIRMNDTGGDVTALLPSKDKAGGEAGSAADAAVGGGSGPAG
ncbi:MAG TPA: MSMEG_4193 family putative phosphomutase [Mycobacteriales bacterium]|nr:MSMEG_4193 family putative phosphomutase [Mycobacteriales bacterium]